MCLSKRRSRTDVKRTSKKHGIVNRLMHKAMALLLMAGGVCVSFSVLAQEHNPQALPGVQTPSPSSHSFSQRLSAAALERTHHSVIYDGAYQKIAYPGGDVAPNKGVCTDVIIRSYRALGIDLQKRVHEDMLKNFNAYPSHRIWGLTRPDSNIDHRRVPNLQTFFRRYGTALPVTQNPEAYLPGDIVTWMLPGNLPHIGIVVDKKQPGTQQYKIVHNVGLGPKLDDVLFAYTITGHYRFNLDVNQIPE